jgi:hypothetical protein
MTITKVAYGKTINIGNYESIRIDLEATVEGQEHYHDNLLKLKKLMADEEQLIRHEQARR